MKNLKLNICISWTSLLPISRRSLIRLSLDLRRSCFDSSRSSSWSFNRSLAWSESIWVSICAISSSCLVMFVCTTSSSNKESEMEPQNAIKKNNRCYFGKMFPLVRSATFPTSVPLLPFSSSPFPFPSLSPPFPLPLHGQMQRNYFAIWKRAQCYISTSECTIWSTGNVLVLASCKTDEQ